MKKTVLAIVCLFVCFSVSAQLPFDVQAGISTGYDFYHFVYYSALPAVKQIMHRLPVGCFIDLEYARLEVGYITFLAGTDYSTGSSIAFPSDTSISSIDFSLILKYPFPLNGIKLWPALGLKYELPLVYKYNGTDYLSDSADYALGNFALVGGCGVDIRLGSFVLAPAALLSYSLTPNIYKNNTPDSVFRYDFLAEIALAYAF